MSIYLGTSPVAGGIEGNQLNNPFSLLDYKFSEYEISNASWLRSNGQFNSGEVYSSVYNLLQGIYNGTVTKAGVSVKLSTETYEDTDFVLNTSDITFRLPLKVALASSKAVVGNGMTLGLLTSQNGVGVTAGLSQGGSAGQMVASQSKYGLNAGSIGGTAGTVGLDRTIGITLDPTKSGIETSADGLYLYFYVGAVVQNANLINAGQVLNDIANLKNGIGYSNTGKETIIDWSMLDYSAVIDVTSSLYSNKYYTAPKRGVLFNSMIPNQNTPIKINGYTIGIRRYSTYGNWIPTPYSMQNGDTFSVTGWIGSDGGAYFVPLKGAN